MDGRRGLLEWFEPRARAYPWRERPEPYRVLVSEVMLQQTQAARVAQVFDRFIERFPTVAALGAASRADVLKAWAGLGYNRRAVALSVAARRIVRDHGGSIPSDPDVLRSLPGVGPYTAAAVASIAYGARVAAVDTNVRRVIARARLGVEPERATPASVRTEADRWLPSDRPGDWNQALMDLGRQFCRPVPRCASCPLRPSCRLEAAGQVGVAPRARPAVEPFAGSMRQVRGSVIRTLRERPAATVRVLARASGRSLAMVATAVAALAAEGMVEASREAMAGEPAGEVRLAEGSA